MTQFIAVTNLWIGAIVVDVNFLIFILKPYFEI